MTLQLLLVDFSRTLVSGGKPVVGMPELLARLRSAGVRVVVVSNEPVRRVQQILSRLQIVVDDVEAPETIGYRKPSPNFCTVPAGRLGIPMSGVVYLGDNDRTDAFAAGNAKVLYLSARWADPAAIYGIPMANPQAVAEFIERYCLAEPRWAWRLDHTDAVGRLVEVRSLLWATRASADLKQVLKFGGNPIVGQVRLRSFLFRRLLTSLYFDGLVQNVDLWAWYPSHNGNPKADPFQAFMLRASRLFKDRAAIGLLHRHKPATKLATARANGDRPGFENQMNTVHLSAADVAPARLQGKHVLVLDDFCTEGQSFEAARNLLLKAGAGRVTAVSFGRYHDAMTVQVPRRGLRFDPWIANTFAVRDFLGASVPGVRDYQADVLAAALMAKVIAPLV